MITTLHLVGDIIPNSGVILKGIKEPDDIQGCPTVALLHQPATGTSKRATNQKLKALFYWEFFAKHDLMSLLDISLELFLIMIFLNCIKKKQ